MIEVLYYSQKDVKQRLFARVGEAKGLLLVCGVRHSKFMSPIKEREPFVSLEEWFGDVLDQVVVADDGSPEGMWRDPMGNLADSLFPDDRTSAYTAASGYVILQGGRVESLVKKHAGGEEDLWYLQEALAKVSPMVPKPDPSRRPGKGKRPSGDFAPEERPRMDRPSEERPRVARPGGEQAGGERPRVAYPSEERRSGERPRVTHPNEERRSGERPRVTHPSEERRSGERPRVDRPSGERPRVDRPSGERPRVQQQAPEQPPAPSASTPPEDPWALLGIPRGTPLAEAKKAFRTLIAQYHPDKVAHMAEEFRTLAEQRTRQILDAWQRIEKETPK